MTKVSIDKRNFPFKTYLPYLVIIVAGVLIFGLFFSPMIYYDDWNGFVGRYYFHLTSWIRPTFSRPFMETSWKLLISIFGFAPVPFLISNIVIRITTALVIYHIFKEIRPTRPDMGLAFALLTLVYPANQTRMWLVLIFLGWVLGCFCAWLLYRYSRNGKVWLLLIVALGYAYAFLEYEGTLGILTAWGVLLMLYTFPALNPPGKRISWLRWAGLGMPLVLFGAYLFYRLDLIYMIGLRGFHQIKAADPLSLMQNLAAGAYALSYGWIKPLHALVPGSQIRWLVSIALILMAIWFLLGWRWSVYQARRHSWLPVSEDERRYAIRQSLFTCAAGLVLSIAGYFPFIAYAPPGLDFFSSRFNIYAVVGASLLLVGLVDLLAWAVVRNTRQAAMLFSLFILPFIIVGTGSELAIQRQTQLLWQEYRQMWQGIFRAAPGLQDNAAVVLVVAHTSCNPVEYGERQYFFSAIANLELTNALNAFYGTQHISADFVYQGCDLPNQVRFKRAGFNNPPSYDGLQPYKQAVILIYDRQTRQVRLADTLKDVTGFDAPEYQPLQWITSGPGPNQMRYLVEP